MKIKAITVVFLTSMLALMWSSASWAAERSNRRENRRAEGIARQERNHQPGLTANNRPNRIVERRSDKQRLRIQQGIRSGEITRPEARGLRKEQRRIDRAHDRALSDGRRNRHERRQLQWMQDRASRHIYRYKHNPASRHWRRHYQYHGYWPYFHRRGARHSHNVYNYYPMTGNGYSNSYQFSTGVSDTGWQFDFGTTINR